MMVSRIRLWWQKTRKLPVVIGLITLIGLFLLIFAGYWFKWNWTGFNEQVGPPVQQYQPAKTLWNWLQLLGVFAIAAAVGIGMVWFATKHGQVSDAVNKHGQASEAMNKDNQREAALQAYIDKMSELLLREGLRGSAEDAEARKIARVRTLAVLRGLDAARKVSVLQFLYEASLIDKDKPVINLTGADLRDIDLSGVELHLADLRGVDLRGADLRSAGLSGANFHLANLSGADLSGASLAQAKLFLANLSRTNLSGTDLSGANLHLANLSGTDLSKTNLNGADLSRAKTTTKQLTTAPSSQGEVQPDVVNTPL